MSKLQFTVSEAAFLAEIKVTTLKVWRQRKVVLVEDADEDNRGRWSRFSYGDVLQAATIQCLTNQGMAPNTASMIANSGRHVFPDIFSDFRGSDAPPAYVVAFSSYKLLEGDQSKQFAFANSFEELHQVLSDRSKSPLLEHFSVTDFSAISAKVTFRYFDMTNGKKP